jgi:hypothetical protein
MTKIMFNAIIFKQQLGRFKSEGHKVLFEEMVDSIEHLRNCFSFFGLNDKDA